MSGSLDCAFTFNAIHHFPLAPFLEESCRALRPGGHLFIDTRLRSQNERNIWGRHFPAFAEKEIRLYDLESTIDSVAGLQLIECRPFRCPRICDIERLRQQALNKRYSTFSLYDSKEFAPALERFEPTLG